MSGAALQAKKAKTESKSENLSKSSLGIKVEQNEGLCFNLGEYLEIMATRPIQSLGGWINRSDGAYVKEVNRQSSAFLQGLEKGDVITHVTIGGEKVLIRSDDQFIELIYDLKMKGHKAVKLHLQDGRRVVVEFKNIPNWQDKYTKDYPRK